MLKIIHTILDIIFPPRSTEKVVRSIFREQLETLYRPGQHHDIHYLSDYENQLVQALIKENKYHRNPQAASHLADLLDLWLRTQTGPVTIVPIPLGTKRQKTRGYNQVVEILRYLPKRTTLDIKTNILVRERETVPQTSLQKDQRLQNIIGAFTTPSPEQLHNQSGRIVVIIDDVTTTGATLEVARATLAPLLPSDTTLLCLAFAH